jgi:L-alanine-DL-glutamate epimerase-like enolase superfamily enzyme
MSERVAELRVTAYTVPTDQPESDGTLKWEATTAVVVQVRCGDTWGTGWSYTTPAAARLLDDVLRSHLVGCHPLEVKRTWKQMVHAVRNLGRDGVSATAIAAADTALWDLKARLLGQPMTVVLDACREEVEIYGSGGFTSYTDEQLETQLSDWTTEGLRAVKMKIGRQPERDLERVRRARQAIGIEPQLFVDANGAYSVKQALRFADQFAELGVSWFEEPVPSSDLAGLHQIRARAPMEIAGGEYGYDLLYYQRMLAAESLDVIQADCTRCAGYTGFLQVDALCQAFQKPLSAHCAPSLHVHVGCASPAVRNLEYFHDHVRLENLLFDGVLQPVDGRLRPDPTRPGHGLELKAADARPFQVYG